MPSSPASRTSSTSGSASTTRRCRSSARGPAARTRTTPDPASPSRRRLLWEHILWERLQPRASDPFSGSGNELAAEAAPTSKLPGRTPGGPRTAGFVNAPLRSIIPRLSNRPELAMIDDIKKDAQTRMQKSVEALRHDLTKVRTGRASTALVVHLKVNYYGSDMPLDRKSTRLNSSH